MLNFVSGLARDPAVKGPALLLLPVLKLPLLEEAPWKPPENGPLAVLMPRPLLPIASPRLLLLRKRERPRARSSSAALSLAFCASRLASSSLSASSLRMALGRKRPPEDVPRVVVGAGAEVEGRLPEAETLPSSAVEDEAGCRAVEEPPRVVPRLVPLERVMMDFYVMGWENMGGIKGCWSSGLLR